MKKKYVLPYANLLSLFFKHFGVPLDEEETVKEGFGTITEKSLKNIGVAQTKKGDWKLISKMTEEELKEKEITKAKTTSSADQPLVLQRLDIIEGALEEVKEGLFGINSEMVMVKSQLATMNNTLKDVLAYVKLSPMQEKALSKSSEEDKDSETPAIVNQDKGKEKVTSEDLFETEEEEEGSEKDVEIDKDEDIETDGADDKDD